MDPTGGREPNLQDPDEALIHRILRGDEVALGILYDRYGGRVFSVAKRILQIAEPRRKSFRTSSISSGATPRTSIPSAGHWEAG